jgi:hypothetical protein
MSQVHANDDASGATARQTCGSACLYRASELLDNMNHILLDTRGGQTEADGEALALNVQDIVTLQTDISRDLGEKSHLFSGELCLCYM